MHMFVGYEAKVKKERREKQKHVKGIFESTKRLFGASSCHHNDFPGLSVSCGRAYALSIRSPIRP